MSNQRKAPIFWILGAGLTAIAIQASYCSVKPGFKGVVFNRLSAQFEEPLEQGPHFLIPFIQKPTLFPVKTQRISNILYFTKEKDQYIRYSVKYEPLLDNINDTYRKLGKDYNITMESYANAVLRNAIVDGSVTISNNLENEMKSLLISKFKEYHFNAHDIKLEELKL
ncbi:predicted protein [Naegleria gruberi]|uniref:Prohibitin n=1 Tax=Naegleria gruberi TaxID=5762 RepID=D2V5Q3_NAEGR|nr:uncharacterized protein NAEGRDRAFT_78683 [Naegleria gruberi]EFC47838.1 predicted protein [Naegleria gruberi]|eukprot:XP_002680582.1 predicted protein [Naegleria gruberi strain NEG-M]